MVWVSIHPFIRLREDMTEQLKWSSIEQVELWPLQHQLSLNLVGIM
jgi:hypothetical protein